MFSPLATKHEVAADEAGAAGDEKGHGLAARSACSRSISSFVVAGANLLSFGRFQNVDGIGAGLGWFQR
jgi:hypothetical protein